jgi:hypothetical protein
MLFPGQDFIVEVGAPAADSLRFKCWQDGTLLAEGNLALRSSEAAEPAPRGVERQA